MPFEAARQIVQQGIARRAFPAAAVEAGTSREVRWREAFGSLTYDPGAATASLDTVFDLASVTKVLATTSAAMRLVDDGRVALTDAVARWIPEWHGRDRQSVTVEDLLAHCSGLPAYLPLFRDIAGRDTYRAAIARTALEYEPRTASVYSDLGFILLGLILERAAGAALDELFDVIRASLGLGEIGFLPDEAMRARAAPTEYDPWRGRLLAGEVHDENAAALGGVAPHAGLFATAPAVGAFARWILRARTGEPDACTRLAARDTVRTFTTRMGVPGSSRALGWDTMLPTSSCGTRMSPHAFGHVGFTGTSLWLDPETDIYVVLLTNRVHPSRENRLIREVWPAFHDAVVEELRG